MVRDFVAGLLLTCAIAPAVALRRCFQRAVYECVQRQARYLYLAATRDDTRHPLWLAFEQQVARDFFFGLVLIAAPAIALGHCFDQAGDKYGVSPALLRAIAQVESSMNPRAVNSSHVERTRSIDIGLMQINSSHLPKLARFGIDKDRLLNDPCTNVMVGAWILADKLARHGDDWNGVGAYNAACTQLKGDDCHAARSKYAWRVHRALRPSPSQPRLPSAAAEPIPSLRLISMSGER